MTISPAVIQALGVNFSYLSGVATICYLFEWVKLGIGKSLADKSLFSLYVVFAVWNHYKIIDFSQNDERGFLLLYMVITLMWLFNARARYHLVINRTSRTLVIAGNGRSIPPEPEAFWSPGPITAYRAFVFRHGDLHALVDGRVFMPIRDGKLVPADCRWAPRLHRSPKWDCGCGYYGLKDPADLGGLLSDDLGGLLSEFIVGAEVRLSGLVIEHEAGYRAEYMQIAVLYVKWNDQMALVKPYADFYGIEVRGYRVR